MKNRGVRFFCIKCGKELWKEMSEEMKKTTTIKEAEETAVCSDCFMGLFKEKKNTQLELSI